jgi:hypothetical protein
VRGNPHSRMTIDELTQVLRDSSHGQKLLKRRKENALNIAHTNAHDVLHTMETRKRAKQYQPSSVKFLHTTLDVAGTYKTTPNAKHAAKQRPHVRTTVYATTAISYSASVAHYFKRHSATEYFNTAMNGSGFAKVDAMAIILQAQR